MRGRPRHRSVLYVSARRESASHRAAPDRPGRRAGGARRAGAGEAMRRHAIIALGVAGGSAGGGARPGRGRRPGRRADGGVPRRQARWRSGWLPAACSSASAAGAARPAPAPRSPRSCAQRPGRLRLRDFGSCSRRARDGGGLFVAGIRRRPQPRPQRLGLQGRAQGGHGGRGGPGGAVRERPPAQRPARDLVLLPPRGAELPAHPRAARHARVRRRRWCA